MKTEEYNNEHNDSLRHDQNRIFPHQTVFLSIVLGLNILHWLISTWIWEFRDEFYGFLGISDVDLFNTFSM